MMKHLILLLFISVNLVASQAHGYTHDLHEDHEMGPSCEYCLTASKTKNLENAESLIEIVVPALVSAIEFITENISPLNGIFLPRPRGPPLKNLIPAAL